MALPDASSLFVAAGSQTGLALRVFAVALCIRCQLSLPWSQHSANWLSRRYPLRRSAAARLVRCWCALPRCSADDRLLDCARRLRSIVVALHNRRRLRVAFALPQRARGAACRLLPGVVGCAGCEQSSLRPRPPRLTVLCSRLLFVLLLVCLILAAIVVVLVLESLQQ